MMKAIQRLRNRQNDGGFSLVEVVVSMMLLALLATAAYPLMFNSMKALALNNITTAATVSVQNELEALKANPTCLNLKNAIGTDTLTDARGEKYQVSIDVPLSASCAEGNAVTVNFSARRMVDSVFLIKLQSTQIYVPPASGSVTVLK